MNLFNIKNKIAMIIGAGHLGTTFAKALSQEGAIIAIADKNIQESHKVSTEIVLDGGISSAYVLDVTQKEDHEEVLEAVLDKYGTIDILINGAGVNASNSLFDIELTEWNNIIHTNLTGVFLGCQIFGKYLYDNHKGSIINISSASSGPPLSRAIPYSCSKAAITNLTQNVARELSPWVRCNALRPGFYPTEWSFKNFISNERKEAILNHTPMHRFGHPEELSGAILFLASDTMSSFVTGAEITVDGGFSAMTI